MSDELPVDDPDIPLRDKRRIDRICDSFEAQWLLDNRPEIAIYVAEADDLRPALLRELIQVDLFYRRRKGELPQAENYAGRFPDIDAAWLSAAIEQIGNDAAAELPSDRGKSAPIDSICSASRFGDYEILDEIAHGGMGIVYKARQASLNRVVALKMILSGPMATPADIERFHAEAEVASRLDHPGIVPIFEVGQVEGRHFYSMGFVEGRSLASRLAEGPLPPREAAALLHSICDAAQYAHDRGVIHRDLKPANVMIDAEGRPRITDFGLAKCLSDDAGRTTTGQMLGTPSYIPPEQAAGKLDLVGPASDIYALGAMLYALLTGRPPFQAASSIDTLRQVIDDEPLPPRDLAPSTPRDLETIALKCLQKPIDQRYASARAMGGDLQRFLDGAPILARPVGRWEQFGRWCKRKPLLAALSAAIVVLLAAIAAVSTTAAVGYRRQLVRVETAKQAEDTAKQDALAELWDSYVATARAGRTSRRPGQRFESLRAIQRAMAMATPKGRSTDELRTEAIAALSLPDFEEAKQLPGYLRGMFPVTVDAKFRRYARGDADGRVSIRQVADDVEICQLPGIGRFPDYEGLDFGPDGRFFMQCCTTPQGLIRRIWKIQTSPTLVCSCSGACEFAPDGRRLATVAKDSLRVVDLESGKELERCPLAGPAADLLLWNPRQPILCARSADHVSYRLLNLETGRFGPSISTPFPILWMRWHPEGLVLAIADNTSHPKIHFVRADSGRPETPPLEAHRTGGLIIRFNQYGDRLLSNDWTGLWRLWDARTGELLLTQPAGGHELRFGDDDQLAGLDSSPQGIRMFRFESGREVYRIVHRAKSATAPYSDPDCGTCQLDPEGRLLAFPVPEGIAVVDVIRGEDAALLRMSSIWPIRTDDSGALFTHGSAGLQRWPMHRDAATGSRVYGPPQKLAPAMGRLLNGAAGDRRCQVFAFPNLNESTCELLLPEGRQIQFGRQDDVRHCAVSSDGRWVVTASFATLKDSAVKIWDAPTGHFNRDLPAGAVGVVAFSPDGKWLLTTGGGARLWSVGDWKEGPSLGASAKRGDFSSGGELLALQDVPGVVRLVVTATGKEIARLTAPEPTRLAPLYFTRDGSRLICWADEEESLFVFNLGLIRSKLAAMGLDWEAPPCPANDGPLPAAVGVQFIAGK